MAFLGPIVAYDEYYIIGKNLDTLPQVLFFKLFS